MLFAILFTGLSTSCTKHDQTATPKFFIGATKQNTDWIADPSTGFIPTPDTLQIRGYHATGEENLEFKIRFNGIGTYQITGSQAIYYTTLGQDAITSRYILDAAATNTVSITAYNYATNIATGNFQLSFVKTYGGSVSPNSVSFTGGQFWLQLPK